MMLSKFAKLKALQVKDIIIATDGTRKVVITTSEARYEMRIERVTNNSDDVWRLNTRGWYTRRFLAADVQNMVSVLDVETQAV
ncbi:hypothetical protein Tco_0359719 [Tanacetum coccineum]